MVLNIGEATQLAMQKIYANFAFIPPKPQTSQRDVPLNLLHLTTSYNKHPQLCCCDSLAFLILLACNWHLGCMRDTSAFAVRLTAHQVWLADAGRIARCQMELCAVCGAVCKDVLSLGCHSHDVHRWRGWPLQGGAPPQSWQSLDKEVGLLVLLKTKS